MKTQLLCTFCDDHTLDTVVDQIQRTYNISFGMIYVLENTEIHGSLCCTYNVSVDSEVKSSIPEGTISLHRKKTTNTLYTINALNTLIMELNNGVLDKRFPIHWEDYKNMILVTAYGKLKKIPTTLREIISLEDM